MDDVAIARTRDGFRIQARCQVPSGIRVQETGIVLVGRGTVIDGGVYLAGSLYTQPRVRIHGPIHVRGRVVLGAHNLVGGDIDADGDVRILPGARVARGIVSRTEVHVFDGAAVDGAIRSGGDIVIWGDAQTGPLHPEGRIRTEPFPRGVPVVSPAPDRPAATAPADT